MRRAASFLVVCVASVGSAVIAAGETAKAPSGFQDSVAKLSALFRTADSPNGPAGGQPGVDIQAAENGMLVIRTLAQTDRSQFSFRSVAEQTWRVAPGDIDAKAVEVRLDPIGVYVPVKKLMKRIVVERSEEKTRIEKADLPGKQWQEKSRFTTSFVFIPASDPRQADEAAALIKQIIKTAPKAKK